MSPELQQQLTELLASLMASAKDASVWAQGEIPALIAEKVRFGIAENALFLVGCVAVATFCVVSFRRAKARKESDRYGVDAGLEIFSPAVSMSAGLIAAGLALACLHDLLLVLIAPRLYIVEWLTTFAR